jgi:hypothetical protein
LKSLAQGLGGPDFWRVRAGVGRPDSTDPEVVSAYVLSRFAEPGEQVRELVRRAADETEQLVVRLARASDEVAHPASPDDRSPSAPSAAEPAAPTAPEPGGSAKEPPE